MGHQPALVRELQNVGRVVGLAAKLARQRPFGARAVAMDTADHAAARRRAGDLLHLGLAIDGIERNAELECRGDLALLLDRVAIGDALRRRAGRQHVVRLADRGDVKAGAETDQQAQDLRRRIGLDGIEHLGVGQRLGEAEIVLAHDVEVEHEARSVIGAVFQKFADACGHFDPAPLSGRRRCRRGEPAVTRRVPRTAGNSPRHAIAALVRMREIPFRTAGKEGQAFSVNRHFRRGSKKARSVVALSRVPR